MPVNVKFLLILQWISNELQVNVLTLSAKLLDKLGSS